MTATEWVGQNYEDIRKWLRNVTRGRATELFDDFVHEMILAFLESPKAQIAVDRGEGRFLLVRIAINNWRSETSPWAKQNWGQALPLLRDFEMEDEPYQHEDDVILNLIIGILDEMLMGEIEEYYMALVLMINLELNGNFSEMSRRLDIPRSSLGKVHREAIEQIKHRLTLKIKQLENGDLKLTDDPFVVIDRWNELADVAARKANTVHARAVRRGFFRNL